MNATPTNGTIRQSRIRASDTDPIDFYVTVTKSVGGFAISWRINDEVETATYVTRAEALEIYEKQVRAFGPGLDGLDEDGSQIWDETDVDFSRTTVNVKAHGSTDASLDEKGAVGDLVDHATGRVADGAVPEVPKPVSVTPQEAVPAPTPVPVGSNARLSDTSGPPSYICACPICGQNNRVLQDEARAQNCGKCGAILRQARSATPSAPATSPASRPFTPLPTVSANPTLATAEDMAVAIAEGRRLHSVHATAWSSWEAGEDPYGSRIQALTRVWAEHAAFNRLGARPQPDHSAVDRWERNRTNSIGAAWILGPASMAYFGAHLQSPFVFVCVGALVAMVAAVHVVPKPELPEAPKDPARIKFVDSLVAAADGAAREADRLWRAATEGPLPWSTGPHPGPVRTITPTGAEHLAAAWMRYLGAEQVQVTAATRDGGVDVRAAGFLAQVKHQATPVAPAAVQQIAGIAHTEGKVALFFALTGYSRAAVDFADRSSIALFSYDPLSATIAAHSVAGRLVLDRGLNTLLG